MGNPAAFYENVIELRAGRPFVLNTLLRRLVDGQYVRNDVAPKAGDFRVNGDTVDILLAYSDDILRITFWGDEIETIEEIKPTILRKENIPREVFSQVRTAMRAVITEGEARTPMNNPYFKLAGKTGTAEVGVEGKYHSWMLSYGPYDAKPEDMVVVACIIEARNGWEWWAPYASNIILQGVLAKQTFNEAVEALKFDKLPQLQRRENQ